MQRRADKDEAAIFAAHQELLEDPDLLDIAESAIAKGKSAAFAWQRAYTTHAERLAQLRNELLAGRANDLRDVGRRVLGIITGQPLEEPELPPETILIAEELTPSDTASLDRTRVLGFCTVGGGATSHVAILARALDIPAMAGIEPRALDIEDGKPVILDGTRGTLRLDPDPRRLSGSKSSRRRPPRSARRTWPRRTSRPPRSTGIGSRWLPTSAARKTRARRSRWGPRVSACCAPSSFTWTGQPRLTEDEQYQIYDGISQALEGRPMIIRTLDVGGDKPLPYMPLPREENPFLGVRGMRIALDTAGDSAHPDQGHSAGHERRPAGASCFQ